jgi:periplasmic divalent cation tolerance protein
MSLATLYMTAPSREDAERIGRELLERRLVACVNIIDNILSLYWWEGSIQREPEAVLIAKTQMQVAHRCIELIKEIHPYDVPCITVMPILKSLPDYRAWVERETTTTGGDPT